MDKNKKKSILVNLTETFSTNSFEEDKRKNSVNKERKENATLFIANISILLFTFHILNLNHN